MSKFDSPLDNIKIASPCSADWDQMFGNDRMRFCAECKLNVYNLSGMTRDAAENLIMNAEGRLCVRFYRRIDGTIITENCPVGWARVKQRAKVYVTAAFSLVLSLVGGLFIVSLFSKHNRPVEVGVLVRPTPTPVPLMGVVANKPSTNSDIRSEYVGVIGRVAIPDRKVRQPKRRNN
jgi:hypothetical protein